MIVRVDPVREGVTATYFADTGWSSTPVVSRIEPRPSSRSFADAWTNGTPDAFSVTWSGKLVLLRGGTYTFASDSDDGSWVYIDGQLVVDNPGRHGPLRRSGAVDLARGDHDIFVKYFQDGGTSSFELLWARNAAALEPIPSWALVPRQAEFRRLAASVIARRLHGSVVWFWLAAIAVSLAVEARRPLGRWMAALRATPESRALASIVALSIGLNVAGVWWGVPSDWAGDEITPGIVRYAVEHGFTNGWYDRYPPFHMQVLGLVFSPWRILRDARLIDATELTEYGVLLILSRMVSVAAAAGTVVALFRAGRDAFGARAGLMAATALALLTPFLYYAKTANPEVPYVFWFSVATVFYLRLLRTLALRDFVGFALAAILSICTKDQAYGLYLLTPLPMIYRLWQSHRSAGTARPFVNAVFDRRLWIAGVSAAAVFALVHNIAFNASGFVKHVQDITGVGQAGYQMVDATIRGRVDLLRVTAGLNQRSWGWPLWLVSLAGIAIALKDRATRFAAGSLLLFAVAYYLGFINVIRYAFDRYLLPVCFVQALFAGFALDRWVRRWQAAAPVFARTTVGLVLAYTALYAVTVDVLMIRDARYSAERWLKAHGAEHQITGIVFPITVQPRLQAFQTIVIHSVDDLREARPDYFILNADYARAVPPAQPEARLVEGLQRETLGYRLAFRYRAAVPWPWLPAGHPNLTGPRIELPVVSVLTQVNPTIEIYARNDGEASR